MASSSAVILFVCAFLALSAMLLPFMRHQSRALEYALTCLLLIMLACGLADALSVRICLGIASIVLVLPLCISIVSLHKKNKSTNNRKKG